MTIAARGSPCPGRHRRCSCDKPLRVPANSSSNITSLTFGAYRERQVGARLSAMSLYPLRYVAVGGAVGALIRWAVVEQFDQSKTTTIVVLNIIGSLILGLLVGARRTRSRRARITENHFLLLGTGFCGGLTTFSTFALDVAKAIDNGQAGQAALLTVTTAALAIVASGIGYRIGSRP